MNSVGNLHGRMPTKGKEITEHDEQSGAKRIIGKVQGNTVSYEDTNFTSGDSPAVMDVYAAIGRNGYKGYFLNDGPGDIQVEISNDGTNYGGQHTLRGGELLSLNELNVARIRITYIDPTEYRALVAG